MRSNSSTLPLSLATLGTVVLIVACSPNNGKMAITAQPPAPGQEKISSCADSLRSSQKLRVGDKRSVVVCEIPDGGGIAAKPVPVTQSVSFSVQSGSDDKGARSGSAVIDVSVKLGLDTKDTISDDDRKAFVTILSSLCADPTSEIFERSRFSGARLKLEMNLVFPTADDGFGGDEDVDQFFHVKKEQQGSDIFWTFAQLPTRPRFYALGTSADKQACLAQFPNDRAAANKCRAEKRRQTNLPLCVALAKRVGNLLGLVDAETEAKTCGAVQPAPAVEAAAAPETKTAEAKTTEAKPQPGTPDDSSSFSKPRGMSDDDFMAKASLNQKDLMTILAPVCPNQLKDMK